MSLRDEGLQNNDIDENNIDENNINETTLNETVSNETNETSSNEQMKTSKTQALKDLDVLVKDLADVYLVVKEVLKKARDVKRDVEREMRELKKKSGRRTRRPDAKPGGVCKPVRISNQLADFIGIDHGQLIPRTQVSKKINEYIRDNNLQDLSDRRILLPNAALEKLFSSDYVQGNKLDFFSLQKFIKHHYVKE